MKLYKILMLGCLVAMTAPSINSQSISTPYSRYGYGVLSDNSTSAQRAMGGVGYAMNSGRQINVMNPASYAAIDSLTFLFDMGVDLSNLWTTDGANKGTKLGGGLDYVTMQFPVTKYGGASIGFLPYSQVGYSITESINHGTSIYEGSGGINQLYFGLAAKPYKGLTVGVNVSYLFGTITFDNYTYPSNSTSVGLFQTKMEVKDYMIEIGVQYSYQLNRRNRLTLGATFTPGKSLHGTYTRLNYNEISGDTISTPMGDKFSQAYKIGVGLNWQWNDRLMVEADATFQPWGSAKFGVDGERLVDRYRGAIGAQYCINPRGNYLDRVQWRAGFSLTRDYWMIQGNTIRQVGVHAGVGLPAPGSKTMINLSFEYQHRQGHPNPLIHEKYLFITLGVNFNELWFWQNKIR